MDLGFWKNIPLLGDASDPPFSDSDFINKLFPNGLWDLIIQLLAFVVLLLIVFFLGYKPVKKMVAARRAHIANEISSAEEANKIAQKAAQEKDATIAEGKEKASQIVANAKMQAEGERSRILEEAAQEAERKRKQADADIALAKEKSKQDVQRQIVEVALAASSKILEREVSEQDSKKLVEDFVSDIKKK